MLPAVGQGALAIETRDNDPATLELITPLDHPSTRFACVAERALLRALGGGCQLPIAGYAVERQHHLRLDGLVAAASGDTVLRETIEGHAFEATQMGEMLAERLLKSGAGLFLLAA
jgi:hydroxymethylbilane synthase